MKRKRYCASCNARTTQVADINAYSRPVWECQCCYVKTPRRVRRVMPSDPNLERLFAELTGDTGVPERKET